jgi:hypothetical protein
MILPDAASIAVGGLKVEMRQAKEQVADLKQQVHQMQIMQAATAQATSSGNNLFLNADPQLAALLLQNTTVAATSVAAGEDEDSSIPDWLTDDDAADDPPVDPGALDDVVSQS